MIGFLFQTRNISAPLFPPPGARSRILAGFDVGHELIPSAGVDIDPDPKGTSRELFKAVAKAKGHPESWVEEFKAIITRELSFRLTKILFRRCASPLLRGRPLDDIGPTVPSSALRTGVPGGLIALKRKRSLRASNQPLESLKSEASKDYLIFRWSENGHKKVNASHSWCSIAAYTGSAGGAGGLPSNTAAEVLLGFANSRLI